MNLSVDKPCLFENEETETVDLDSATFEVKDNGDLLIKNSSTKDLIGYFPKGKWSCVYRRDD